MAETLPLADQAPIVATGVQRERNVAKPARPARIGRRIKAVQGPDQSPIHISLLGDLRIDRGDASIDATDLGGRRGEIACARLASDLGRSVSRDQLAAAIWDDQLPGSWQSALRNVIAKSRGALTGADLDRELQIASTENGYRLEVDAALEVDVLVLENEVEDAERAAGRGEHDAALRLCSAAWPRTRQTALPAATGDWVEALRSRVEELRVRVAQTGSRAALELGEHERAERFARDLVAVAPLREQGHRNLMEALQMGGNRGQALDAYEAARRRLVDELGTAPSQETEALFLEILGEDSGSESYDDPTAGGLRLIQRQTAFVGREAILAELVAAVEVARRSGPRVVAISGEPGIGKTRLAAELAAVVGAKGTPVLYGRADDRIPLAYQAPIEALDRFFAAVGAAEMARRMGSAAGTLAGLVPALAQVVAPEPPTGLPELDRRHQTQSIARALRAVATERGAVLVLDDMQWATAPTLAVLEELLAVEEHSPLAVVILHRGISDPGSLPGWDGDRVRRIALEPMTAADVAALAGSIAAEIAADSLESVWRHSGGNALLAAELLRDGETSSSHLPVLVRERVARLPRGAGEVLEVAAAAGLVFQPETVIATTQLDPGQARAVLAAAEGELLLVRSSQRPGRLEFRHSLVRDSLLESIPEARLPAIHARLAATLEREGIEDAATRAGLAYHVGAAAPLGDWERAIRYSLPVARSAFDSGAFEDAAAIARGTLVALGAADDPDPGARLDALILLAASRRALGDPAGQEGLAAAFAEARELGDGQRMADAALQFSSGGATADEAYLDGAYVSHYEEALGRVDEGDLSRRARLMGHLAIGYAWADDGTAAHRIAAEAVERAREVGEPAVLLPVLTTARRIDTGPTDLEGQWRMEDELTALGDELDDPGARTGAAVWRFQTLIERGEGAGLERQLELAEKSAAELRMGSYHHSVAYARAALALLRGRPEEAEELSAGAAAFGASVGIVPPITEGIRVMQLLGIRTIQNRLGEAGEELLPFFDDPEAAEWSSVMAIVAAEAGDHETARAHLDTYFESFVRKGPTMINSLPLASQTARPIARLGATDHARSLYEAISPYSGAGGYITHFAGPMDYALGLLADVLDRPEDANAFFEAGAGFCRGLGAPLWEELCRSGRAGLDTPLPLPPPEASRLSR